MCCLCTYIAVVGALLLTSFVLAGFVQFAEDEGLSSVKDVPLGQSFLIMLMHLIYAASLCLCAH